MISTNQQRYLVALPRGNQRVFLSWRLLASDRPDAPFHVERRRGPGDTWQRVTSAPVVDSTTFLDHAPEAAGYEYRVLADGDTPSEIVTIDAGAPASMIAFDIPLDPEDAVEDIALGDLTNSGRMGYVLRAARAGTVWLVAYRYDGKLLWECDTRLPARGGWDGSTRHVPVLCWDVNGDGRTEVAFHTCRGTYPGDLYEQGGADEYLTVVDGETGDTVWEAPWPARKPRVMMTVGHLRGMDQPPSLVILDETYRDVTLTAVDGRTSEVAWRVEQGPPGWPQPRHCRH